MEAQLDAVVKAIFYSECFFFLLLFPNDGGIGDEYSSTMTLFLKKVLKKNSGPQTLSDAGTFGNGAFCHGTPV